MKTYSYGWIILPLWLIAVHPAAAVPGGNFAPAVTCGVGLNPIAVTASDVNGDGRVELISANNSEPTLTVLTNNGTGAFGSNDALVVDSGPFNVTAADINGDGKPDLIVASYFGSALTVLTNNGNGGYGFHATLLVGAGPVCVATADIHGNGKPDLISANGAEGTLTVLTNNGSGGYGTQATLPVGFSSSSSPNSVAVADFNGDGKLDLVSANYADNSLTVYTNDGVNNFIFSTTLAVQNIIVVPYSVAAADVNGDGKVDLICANGATSSLTVLTNNGSGGFGVAATLPAGDAPYSVIAADINGDGKVDLISANSNTNTLTVLTNNGSGGFGFFKTLTVGATPLAVVAADVNGDGRLDLISANYTDSTLSVILNQAPTITSPKLAISLTGPGTAVISWPSAADGFVLQQKTNLAAVNWLDFNGTVTTNGAAKSTTIAPPVGSRFFRLYHP